MNMIEEKLAEIIRENDADQAASVIYQIMVACVQSEQVNTTANAYRIIDRAVDLACEQNFE